MMMDEDDDEDIDLAPNPNDAVDSSNVNNVDNESQNRLQRQPDGSALEAVIRARAQRENAGNNEEQRRSNMMDFGGDPLDMMAANQMDFGGDPDERDIARAMYG